MGLEELRVVRTRVERDRARGVFEFGSGYVIASGVVLTAAHVLEPVEGVPAEVGQDCEVLRWGTETWEPAVVRWWTEAPTWR